MQQLLAEYNTGGIEISPLTVPIVQVSSDCGAVTTGKVVSLHLASTWLRLDLLTGFRRIGLPSDVPKKLGRVLKT